MAAAVVHAQCNSCGSWSITSQDPPDVAVRCTSDEGSPEGSVRGSCCTKGHTHEEHAQYAREQHEDGSQCRPITITIMGAPEAGGEAPYGVRLEGAS